MLETLISPLHAYKSIIKLQCKHKSAILVVAIFIERKHVNFETFLYHISAPEYHVSKCGSFVVCSAKSD